MADKVLYRVKFRSEDKMYEIYAKSVYQADLMGFVAIEGLSFANPANSSVIANPVEEKMREEFADSELVLLPMHSIFRIERVRSRGASKIVQLDLSKQPNQNIVYSSPEPDGGNTNNNPT